MGGGGPNGLSQFGGGGILCGGGPPIVGFCLSPSFGIIGIPSGMGGIDPSGGGTIGPGGGMPIGGIMGGPNGVMPGSGIGGGGKPTQTRLYFLITLS